MAKKIDHKFWEKYFKVYDVLNYVIPYQELLDTIVEKLEIKEGDLVLDAGCGTGNLAIKMKEKGARVIGLDNCNEALERYLIKNPEAEIVKHDLAVPLPFPDNYFDKIGINNVVYTFEIDNRKAILKELYRVLKPNGVLVVSNSRKGIKPILIYFDTIKKQRKKSGVFVTLGMIFQMLVPTIKMLIYNKWLDKEDRDGKIDFVEKNEQYDLLLSSGFESVSENLSVYSGQAILNSGVK